MRDFPKVDTQVQILMGVYEAERNRLTMSKWEWYDKSSGSVIVIRTNDVEKVKNFFEHLGLEFVKEKHGDGPEHYACEKDESVLEVYPEGE